MNLNKLFISIQKDTTKNYLKKLENLIKKEIGFKLITITAIHPSQKYVERIYSNNKKVYPIFGRKPIPKNNWSKIIKKNGQKFFLGKNKSSIKKIFFDYETIFSLGCGSIINYVIRYNGIALGTLNILDVENKYSNKHIKKIEKISIFMIPYFLQFQNMKENKRKPHER